jgi:hypothetical protein
VALESLKAALTEEAMKDIAKSGGKVEEVEAEPEQI